MYIYINGSTQTVPLPKDLKLAAAPLVLTPLVPFRSSCITITITIITIIMFITITITIITITITTLLYYCYYYHYYYYYYYYYYRLSLSEPGGRLGAVGRGVRGGLGRYSI